jgi:hypothetical protein
MTWLALLAALPCLFWTQGVESAGTLQAAGVTRLCVPPARSEAWRAAGFSVVPLDETDLAARIEATTPRIRVRADRASATRSPWVYANGWQFRRDPAGRYSYELPAGKAALAAAEAFAYGVDAALAIDPADVPELGRMQAFLAGLPPSDLAEVADLGVVDDGSDDVAEVLNLLSRRNLLHRIVKGPSAQFPVTVQLGTKGYPVEDVSDPSEFALKVRRQLGDAQRSLRIFGSEVVIARLTGDATRLRLHLLNYGGSDIEALRVRVRGSYPTAQAQVSGQGGVTVTDQLVAGGATEFTLPRLTVYGVVDLSTSR